MDPVTVATTVFSFVAFVQGLQELAQKIKETIEKVPENRKKLRTVSANSVRHLVELEEVTRTHEGDVLVSPQLQDALTELREELLRIHRHCWKRLGSQKRGLALLCSRLKAWNDAKKLEGEMLSFESNVRACEMRFLTCAMVRLEKRAHAQTYVLHAISDASDEHRSALAQIGQTVRQGVPQLPKLEESPSEVISSQSSVDFVSRNSIVAKPSLIATLSNTGKAEMASHSIDMYLESLKEVFSRPVTFTLLRKDYSHVEPYTRTPGYIYSIEDSSVQAKDTIIEISWILKMMRAPHPQIDAADCAKHLHELAMTLGDLGMHTEALSILSWTVTLYREMYRDQPGVFAPYLARSLHFIGLYRLKLGQYSATVVASTEAATLYRQAYAAATEDDLAADLGMALKIRSCGLRRIGQARREEALRVCGEAVSIFRELVRSREDFTIELAMVLGTQARHFHDAGLSDKAFEYGQEAVDLLSAKVDEAHDNPSAQIQLAGALFSHAFHLWKAGRSLDCLEVNEKAIMLWRSLYAARPKAWRLKFCDALNHQASYHYSIGQHDDALRLSQEALDLMRGVVTTTMECNMFAGILETPALVFEAMGRFEDALHAVEEIVYTIYNFPAFQSRNAQLAKALRWAAKLLRALQRDPEAQLREEEAALLDVEPDGKV